MCFKTRTQKSEQGCFQLKTQTGEKHKSICTSDSNGDYFEFVGFLFVRTGTFQR